ncbi:MAG: AAA family ATPase [Methanobrevibacter sp.]|nr:AAA family ATPase [Methanobrevibacter sp.]
MEFKSIIIKNFLSYFDENEIEFSDTTTIFIGQNNTGKSKIFDAINFALYERIWITDKGENGAWIYSDKEIATFILNNHKKNIAIKENEENIDVSVTLVMDDGNSFITVERVYLYRKTESGYEYKTKNFSLTVADPITGNISTYMGQEATDKLNMYFSPSIKDYFLFQGEASSKIMQLQKGGNFSRAVHEIARLSVFEDAKELAEQYTKHVRNIIARKRNKNKEQREAQEELQFTIEQKQDMLSSYVEKKADADRDIAEYSAQLEHFEEKLSKLKEFEDWFKQKKQIEENKKNIERELKNANSEKTEIAEDAVFYKVREKINSFSDFYSKLEKKGEVPPSINADEIRKALKVFRCTICGTALTEGSEARAFAEARLPKCDTDRLGSYLRDLNTTMGNEAEDINRIPDKLADIISSKRRLDEKRESLRKQDEEVKSLLAQIELDSSNSEEKVREADEIRDKVSNYTNLLEKAKRASGNNEGSISVIKSDILRLQHELNSLIVEDDDIDESDKIKNVYAEKLNVAMDKLYQVAHDTAYNQVQEKANEYYQEMTQENAGIVGKVVIDTDTSEIYTVDEKGTRIRNINQGNRISIQLAVIAGILTVAQDQFNQQYPFVTDAPVSALGGDNKLSTIKSMIDAFEQSIIIIKDDTSSKNKTNDEIRDLIAKSKDVGIAYELSLSKTDSVSDQYTVVTKIKG